MGKFVLAVLALLCVALVSVAIAQEQRQQQPPAQTATPEDKSAQKTKALSGEIVSVDPAKMEVVIKDAAGLETHLLISTSTKITQGDKTIALADLKVGDKLSTDCEESADGCKAKSIKVLPPPPGN